MSAPADWDDKSWFDVQTAHERLVKLVDLLGSALLVEDASADRLCDLFDEIHEVSSFGSAAASWCKVDP